ncbi:hypothetical protein ACFFR3_22070 [Nonomuraea salmonea]|uniref:Single-stranded DNA-binding protein n=1 Tax=Nonomuraea salmonea TaxID=46181 RepID=A0ABV5NPP0_9ACTN
MDDMQISLTGRIAYDPKFWAASDDKPAMWSALLEVAGPPTTGRNGTYVPTRRVEVVAHGLDAVRASQSFHVGHVITVQGRDLIARAYETKDRHDRPVVRGVVQVVAKTLAMSTRYDPIRSHTGDWPPAGSPRMVQGAATPTVEEDLTAPAPAT